MIVFITQIFVLAQSEPATSGLPLEKVTRRLIHFYAEKLIVPHSLSVSL